MKVKVISSEFEKALSGVRPVASKPIFGLGVIGLLFSGKTLHIKAFSEFWIETRISCTGIADDVFVAISPSCIEAMLLYFDDEETEIDVLDTGLKIKSGTFNVLASSSNEDLSPDIDFDEVEWLELPEEIRQIADTSFTSAPQESANVLYVSDYIFSTDGYRASTYRPDWHFNGFIPVPKSTISLVSRIAGKEGEMLLSSTDKLIVLSTGNTYITTPYPEHWEAPPFEEFYGKEDGLIKLSGGTGKVSDSITRELKVCTLQKEDGNTIFLWTDKNENGLHFRSGESEIGRNDGVVWSDLTDFQVRCDASYLMSMIPKGQMWNMHLVARKESPELQLVLIETESGVRSILFPHNSTHEDFERLRSNNDETE